MIFLAHDTDGSGFFRSNEFREALTTGGKLQSHLPIGSSYVAAH